MTGVVPARFVFLFFLSVAVFANCETALAQAMSGTQEVKGNFQSSIGTYVSSGFMSSKNNTIASRTLNSAAGFVQLGHKSGYLMPFLIGDFSAAIQATDSSKVSGTNLSGYSLSAGVGLAARWAQFYISAGYLPFGTYDLTAKTTDGLSVQFSSPVAGLVFVGYEFQAYTAYFVHKYVEYSAMTAGPTTTSLGEDKLVAVSYGGGIAWTF